MPSFGDSKFTVDRDATIDAYRRSADGLDACACSGCRNFRLARERVFPATFLTLLDELGVDFRKPVEVYQCGRIAPGRHAYGGWYNFVGTLDEGVDAPPVDLGRGFSAYLRRASGPRLPCLEGLPIVQLEFTSEEVPWLLDEPESA